MNEVELFLLKNNKIGKENAEQMQEATIWEQIERDTLRRRRLTAMEKIKIWYEKEQRGSKKDRKRKRKKTCL
jgi:hypothetical protein